MSGSGWRFTRNFPNSGASSTRSADELTGNVTLKRGLEHFTSGLSAIFHSYASALKPGAPFVFTYHHNDPAAYIPVVVAVLDAGLHCTATLPAAAEMSASLHIAGTHSSILDSVFVCRVGVARPHNPNLEDVLIKDADAMQAAGVRITLGDLKCLAAGHMARLAIETSRHIGMQRCHSANAWTVSGSILLTLPSSWRSTALATRILKVATPWQPQSPPKPFEVDLAYLHSHLDDMVESVFSDLQSQFLVLPRGKNLVTYGDFQAAYEVLKRHTAAFAIFSEETVLASPA